MTALTDVTSTGTTELDAGKSITFTVDNASEAVNAVGSALTLSNGSDGGLYQRQRQRDADLHLYGGGGRLRARPTSRSPAIAGTIADTAGNALAAAGVSEDTGVAIITAAPTVTRR